VPSNLSKDKKLSYRNFFSYPIKIGDFERKLKNFNYHKGLSFKDIVLRESNHIYNYKSNQKAHFTETEINIISALISKKKLKKESLKLDILKIKNTLNTKSLESHLSRIRKKLNEIDSKVKITSLDLDYININ
jgi:DNA-binding response OmpR family regulator